MWYEIKLPREVGFATSPHELNDKAWRMKNVVWKDDALEDIDIPLCMVYNATNTTPVSPSLSKQAYDVFRVYGWEKTIPERENCITFFSTGLGTEAFDANGNKVIVENNEYRVLPYSLTKYIGAFLMGNTRKYYANGTVHSLATILQKPNKPSVESVLLYSDNAIEYRYKVVFVNENLNFYSPPSDAVGCLGLFNPSSSVRINNVTHDCRIAIFPDVSGSAPTDIDYVYIYRWTEVIGAYVFLKKVSKTDWWAKTTVYDDTPADYVSPDVLPDNIIGLPSGRITALAFINGRMVYALENTIYISEPLKPFWVSTDIPPFVFEGIVENIFRWGSHLLVQTRFSWYRLFETEGGFVVQPLSLPIPTDKTTAKKTKAGLAIVSYRGVYLFTPDEQLLQLPIRIDIMEGNRVITKPAYFRVFRDSVDVVLSDGSYYRIDAEGHVTGLHDRLKVYAWGE